MSTSSLSTIIRKALPSEFPLLAHIHYQSLLRDPIISLLWRHADPSAVRKWYWLEGALPTVQSGSGTVLVAQKQDSDEIVGLAWYLTMSPTNPPTVPRPESFPEGYNVKDSAKLREPRIKWQNSLLAEYGKFIYLDSLAVLPAHQGKGCGSKLMSAVLQEAGRQGLNVALCATPDKNAFYEKFGFKEVQKGALLDDGKVKGDNFMLIETHA